jgi:hypothetical protein
MLNLIHSHLNDSSDDVTFDVVHMTPKKDKNESGLEVVNLGGGQISLESNKREAEEFEEELEEYTEFKKDIHGRPLRYKVLVRDLAIKQILYNTGNSVEKIPFEEFRLSVG